MAAQTNSAVPSSDIVSLEHLSDAELLTRTRSLVGRSTRLLAELLAHLAEVEARGVHRTRACSSLYTYLIYELRFSEDEAFRRVAAARLARRFPALLDAIAAGELHLTGLLMLGPHLTSENVVEVMARAKHRTKREIARLVRVLDPLPSVPARIEPLGPALARLVPPAPTWEQFACSLNPVRHLEAGERPREWGLEDETRERLSAAHGGRGAGADSTITDSTITDSSDVGNDQTHAPARVADDQSGDLAAPQRFMVQFTATEEYVRLVQEAKALLSHRAPRATLEEVQLRALRAFVEALRKRKYGSKAPSRAAAGDGSVSYASDTEAREADPSPFGSDAEAAADPNPRPGASSNPRRRGRHIPAAVRRAVAARDAHRCTYVDASGQRCAETQRLEFHHVLPFAVCRSHDVPNLTLRCQAHNALAAEQDFGHVLIDERRSAARHDSFSKQGP